MSEKSLRNGANHGLLVLAKALPGASGSLALERMQKKIAAAATGGILLSPGKPNGNSGSDKYWRQEGIVMSALKKVLLWIVIAIPPFSFFCAAG